MEICDVMALFLQGNPLPRTFSQQYTFVLHEHGMYGWSPRVSSQDFMRMLANLESIRIRATYTAGGE